MKKIKNTRTVIQLIVLTSVIIAAFNHYLESMGKGIHWISESVFHYICPTCGVVTLYQFLASSTLWMDKLKSIMGITIGLVIIVTILFGPLICSFICPFGAIQDLTARLGKKFFKKKYNHFIPAAVDSKLKYLRYVMLGLTIFLTASSGVMLIEALNPYHAFLGFFSAKTVSLTGALILALVIVTSFFIQRPWCKYLCPYGAFLGLFNKLKVFRVVRKEAGCIGCKRCDKECPMGIEIQSAQTIRDIRCTSCMDCTSQGVCPKAGTLSFTSADLEEEARGTVALEEGSNIGLK